MRSLEKRTYDQISRHGTTLAEHALMMNRRGLVQVPRSLTGAVRGACLCAGLLAFSQLSCAGAMRKAAESAAPAAVETAADEARDPQTREDVAQLLGEPESREATSL